jgi:hypothetical protein
VPSEVLQAQVSDAVATILGRGVAADEPLVAAGLDSLGSVELRNSLQVRSGSDGAPAVHMQLLDL